MKSFLMITIAFFFMQYPVKAQFDNPVAVATEKGIFLYLGNQIPKDGYYEIEKKTTDKSVYNTLGRSKTPQNTEKLQQRIRTYQPYFSNLDPLSALDAARIWEYLQKNTVTDSLYSSNLPIMHLIAGTGYFDSDVSTGKTYRYKVSYYDSNNKFIRVAESNNETWPPAPDLPKPRFREKHISRSQVFLQWYVVGQKDLSTFNVYRSTFGKNEFTKISTTKGYNSREDTVFLIAVDSVGAQPGFYEYYLQPLDIYGNPGSESDTVSAGSIEHAYLLPLTSFTVESAGSNHQIKLNWQTQQKKYTRSIGIMRSNQFDSGYVQIARVPVTDTAYTDIVPQASENYYYYLSIIGPEDEELSTAKVSAMYRNESEKPNPPPEVAAETADGGVRLYWQSDEPYIKGFYVYRSIDESLGFLPISGLEPAGKDIYTYLDSGNNLEGDKIYAYALRAVNDSDALSDFSDTVSARPGIKTSLITPANLRYHLNDGRVLLIWDDLRNQEPNLLGYKVYRKLSGDSQFQWLAGDTLNAEKNHFTDSLLADGITCNYAVAAIDYFGSESALCHPVSVNLQEYYPAPPGNLRAISTKDGVMISWSQMVDEHIKQLKIYRSEPGGKVNALATVDAGSENFLDKSTLKGKLYFYQVSIIDKKNRESAKSGEASIRF